jgi:hypothetical protein
MCSNYSMVQVANTTGLWPDGTSAHAGAAPNTSRSHLTAPAVWRATWHDLPQRSTRSGPPGPVAATEAAGDEHRRAPRPHGRLLKITRGPGKHQAER